MYKRDFWYDLPEELIAQEPAEPRDASRLMVVPKNGEISHRRFSEIGEFLNPGDLLVLNDTRVIPARLYGTREDTGAAVEFLLLRQRCGDVWETLCGPGKKARPGHRFVFGEGLMTAEILDVVEEGNRLVRFEYDGVFFDLLDRIGQMPLPPYIKKRLEDPEKYQTVYSKHPGSAAAPTAGLHFTPRLLSELESAGVGTARVTLHVGLGTFRPVKAERIEDHKMHSEEFFVPGETARRINETKAAGKRVICVGTTACRTVESAAARFPDGELRECGGETDIFITPGYRFRCMDGLITNFHLPESTLLMLVSAFAGHRRVMEAYDIAVKERYRFFSFGDAMLLI